jgi:radical SAM-linked protein
MESLEEFADMQLEGGIADAEKAAERINAALPRGLAVQRIERVESGEPSLAKIVRGFSYRVSLPPESCEEGLEDRIRGLLEAPSIIVEREGKEKLTRTDVRPYVEEITLDRTAGTLEMTLRFADGRTARPAEILRQALGLNDELLRSLRIVKTRTLRERAEG